jgi:hypothetical protein
VRIGRRGEYVVEVDGATMRFQRTAEVSAVALSLAAQFADGLPPERMAGLMRSLGQWLSGWSGVEDESGAPLAATLDNWERFLAECPGMWMAVVHGIADELYVDATTAARADGPDPPSESPDG